MMTTTVNGVWVFFTSIIWTQLTGMSAERTHKGPLFVQEPPSRVDFLNRTGTVIPCSAHGNPTPVISWVGKDGSPVTDVRGLRHLRSDGALVFPPFRAEEYLPDIHVTKYKCVASNIVGTIVSRDVHVRAVLDQKISPEVYDEFVIAGNTAVLRCNVPNNLRDLITVTNWIQEPSLVINPTTNAGSRYSVFPTGELHVRRASLSDSLRSFKCQTKHRLTGEVVISSGSGRITVTEPYSHLPPRITHIMPRITVQEGQPIQLPCASQGYPLPTYFWSKEHNGRFSVMTNNDRVTLLDGTLLIRKVTIKDAGKYVCIVNSTSGEERADTELIVTAPLRVTLTPHNPVITTGSPVVLNCNVSGFPVQTIVWTKNGKPLETNTHVHQLTLHTIRITSVQREDAGMYQCFAFNLMESAQGTAQINAGDNPPHFLHAFSDQTLNPGASVSLRCVATGVPLPQITWTLDNMALPEIPGLRSGDYVTKDNSVVSYVNITSVGVEHGGEYTCIARNDVESVKHSGKLIVLGDPYVRRMKNLTLVAGETMKIKCPVGGYPIQEISWERGGLRLPDNHRQLVHPNGTLIIKAIERDADEGTYTCIARNKEGKQAQGSVTVTIRVRPVIESFVLPSSVHMGQRLSITCTVAKGDPPIKIQWFKDGRLFTENGGVRLHHMADFSSTILFEAVRPEHRGNYTCIASNEAGKARHSAAMVIHVPPRWTIEPSDTSVVQGTNVVIDCQVSGFPVPRINWKRAEGDLPGHYKPISSSPHIQQLENGSLTIRDVKESDSGFYLCKASNGIGSDLSKVIKLTVHVAAHFKSKFRAETARRGKDAKLVCEAFGERPITIAWMRDKQLVNFKIETRYSKKETVFNKGILSELIVNNIDRRDSSLFTCLASNIFGKDETNIQLIVQEPPDTPQDVRVLEVTSRSFHITWSPPFSGNSRLTKYVVYLDEVDGERNLQRRNVSIPATETTWTISDLYPVTNYTVRVSAVNRFGESEPSQVMVISTEEEVPGGPPLSVQAFPVSSTVIKVQWKPPDSALQFGEIRGYYVGYKMKDSSETFVYKTLEVKRGFKEECLIGSLKRLTTYSITVQAFNKKGAGPPSEIIEVETLKADPPKTVSLQVLATTSSSVKLTWARDPTDTNPISGYLLYSRGEHSTWEEHQLEADFTNYSFQNMNCGTRYEFYVIPYNDVGSGDRSRLVVARTDGRAPIAPDKETFLGINSTSATLNLAVWKHGGCPIEYFIIRYKQQRQKRWSIVSEKTPPDQKSLTLDGLLPGTWYQLQITAHSQAGSTEAEYAFITPELRIEGAIPETVLFSDESIPFYLELEILLPVVLSGVVVTAVSVLVCLILHRRQSSGSSYSGGSIYGIRKAHLSEAVAMSGIDKHSKDRKRGRNGAFPSPYATTHLDRNGRHNSISMTSKGDEDTQYATVKRTPRPPKSDLHIYHYPVNTPYSASDEEPSLREDGELRSKSLDQNNQAVSNNKRNANNSSEPPR